MKCMKCGREIPDGSTFCNFCGGKQTTIYTEVFPRGNMGENTLIDSINEWFRTHPAICNVGCQFEIGTAIGLLTNQQRLDKFTLQYEIAKKENPFQYRLVKEKKFSLISQNAKQFVANWEKKNPQCKILSWRGGVNSRGSTASLMLGGLGANNTVAAYILFMFPKAQVPVQPPVPQQIPQSVQQPAPQPVPQPAFCRACGKKLAPGAVFCPQCGNKVR